jgi:hypothetical protein
MLQGGGRLTARCVHRCASFTFWSELEVEEGCLYVRRLFVRLSLERHSGDAESGECAPRVY